MKQLVFASVIVVWMIALSVFAVWTVVADAPWEGENVTISQTAPAVRQPSQCEVLREQLAAAHTDGAARKLLSDMFKEGC